MPQDRAQRPPQPSTAGSNLSAGDIPANSSGSMAGTYFLGRYRVVDEIGVGGMASVHLARMDGPGGFQKWVAIKRIHPHLVEDETFVNMFLDEARIAARISHPNVAHRLRARQARGHLLDRHGVPPRRAAPRGDAPHRGDAASRCPRRSPAASSPTPPRACTPRTSSSARTARSSASSTATSRRTTSSSPTTARTKVVDFGIAKFSSRMASTRAGTLKGKLAYMSPGAGRRRGRSTGGPTSSRSASCSGS